MNHTILPASLTQAYRHGWEAQRNGLPRVAPYPFKTADLQQTTYYHWLLGYDAAIEAFKKYPDVRVIL